MRDIKFRAWDIKHNVMVGVYLVEFLQGGTKIQAPGHTIGGDISVWARVEDEFKEKNKEAAILMQFTGLKDKNGKEIFEGDIIEFEDWSMDTDGDSTEYLETGEVFWDEEEMAYGVSNRSYVALEDLWRGEISIIGNIYENPDLLKRGE